jgi:putative ABC transport system permease protein
VPPVLLGAGLRFYARHPSQLMLTVVGIALGVSVVVGIDLASFSARQAFSISTRLLRGEATHQLSAPAGRMPEDVYRELRVEAGIAAAAPVVEGTVRLVSQPERRISLLGIEPLAAIQFRWSFLPGGVSPGDIVAWLSAPGGVLIPAELANALDHGRENSLTVASPSRGYELLIKGYTEPAGPGISGEYLVADIATAQEALSQLGTLSRIDLRIQHGEQLERVRKLAERRGLRLEAVDDLASNVDTVTRSFRINLQALSLLAVVVGAFLVYSTVSFAVVRRRETFGVMRSLGASRREVYRLVLSETLVLALAGTILGLTFGIVLGSGLVRLVLRTINDLYLSTGVDYYGLSGWVLAKGSALGLGTSLLAAAVPAAEAARSEPRVSMSRAALEQRLRRSFRPWVIIALGFAAAGASVLVSTERLEISLAGIFLLIIAAALATPLCVVGLTRAAAHAAARLRLLAFAYAARSIGAHLSRTGPAVAALMMAIAAFIGIGVMVSSFRTSVQDWLNYRFDADVLIGHESGLAVLEDLVPLDELRRLPGAAGISVSRRVRLPGSTGELLAIKPDTEYGRWPKLSVPRLPVLAQLARGNAVIVSEAFVQKTQLGVGDALTLETPAGPKSFEIAAVFIDYSTDLGVVAIDLDAYQAAFSDRRITSIGVFAKAGRTAELLAAARGLTEARDGVRVASSAFLRELSLQVFDRTFTITQVLRLIAGLVAIIAVFNALQAQRLDTAREVAVLRAQGATPRDVLLLGEIQTGLMGLCAGILAAPVGLLLAWLLIFVVNRIAFGWSMQFLPDARVVLEGIALAVGAALLAGWWPSRRAVTTLPAAGLRQD